MRVKMDSTPSAVVDKPYLGIRFGLPVMYHATHSRTRILKFSKGYSQQIPGALPSYRLIAAHQGSLAPSNLE
jgi:hypothetical protein